MKTGVRVAATGVLLASGWLAVAGWTAQDRPRDSPALVVMIVVDQFRADYVSLYGHQWTRGLKRLWTGGATFPLAAYPHGATKTCPGHVTVATGLLPRTHGMVDNTWFDRASGKSINCTDDPAAQSVPFGGLPGTEHHSARLLLQPTFAEHLRRRRSTPTRVVSLSLKARSAIGLAGRPGPGVMPIWEEAGGTFATSTAYADAPWPEVEAFVQANPIAAAYGDTWTKLLPESQYLFVDNGPGEAAGATFPHPFATPGGKPDSAFVVRWERSPWSDAYLGRMAEWLAGQLKLGQSSGTDILAVSFSGVDLVGHAFGPYSHEVQDALLRLDVTLDSLLTHLDRLVGPGRYTLALTSDHGVPPIPEEAQTRGLHAGRFTSTRVRDAIETALDKGIDPGTTWVANVTSPYIYFTPGSLDRIRQAPDGRALVTQAVLGIPGIARVLWADDLANARTDDAIASMLARSFVPDRSGDLAFVPVPYWVPQATGTTHGSPHQYDIAVPVVFYGAGVTPGRYMTPASPVDIAPTLAEVTGVKLPRTDGRVLREALRR